MCGSSLVTNKTRVDAATGVPVKTTTSNSVVVRTAAQKMLAYEKRHVYIHWFVIGSHIWLGNSVVVHVHVSVYVYLIIMYMYMKMSGI